MLILLVLGQVKSDIVRGGATRFSQLFLENTSMFVFNDEFYHYIVSVVLVRIFYIQKIGFGSGTGSECGSGYFEKCPFDS
jgi:hypothetical protein